MFAITLFQSDREFVGLGMDGNVRGQSEINGCADFSGQVVLVMRVFHLKLEKQIAWSQ